MDSKRANRAVQRRRRKKQKNLSLILFGIAFLLAITVIQLKQYLPVAGAVLEVSGAPSLKVDREILDFGDVRYERPVSASFQLTNVGDRPLKFTRSPYIEVIDGC